MSTTEAMHVPAGKPACFVAAGQVLDERAPWSFDRGKSCGNGHNLADENLKITPGCRGCGRLVRARMIDAGTTEPLPSFSTATKGA